VIRNDIKKTYFFQELEDDKKVVFDVARDKFLPNIDTLYYSVFFKDDSNEADMFNDIFIKLDELKSIAKEKKESPEFDQEHQLSLRSYAIYNYCIHKPDLYDIFISDYLPNISTPRVVVQIRSYGLWVNGVENMINDSFQAVRRIFAEYGVVINFTRENRIDYCYHTNYIQEPYTFFSDNRLSKKLRTTLDVYQKIGHIYKNKITLDYFALGQRKSNNLFVRTYNKSREVIEEGYKSFFFAIWYKQKMISEYDLFCYEYAFTEKSYNALDKARLLYYLKVGKSKTIKDQIEQLLNDINVQYEDILEFANRIMPKVTMILNIEFQTKRKFYYNANMLHLLPVRIKHNVPELTNIYQILDNRKVILDYITDISISFGKHKNDSDKVVYDYWWERLRSVKLDSIDSDFSYVREFSYKCDKVKINKRAINSLASNAVYNNKKDSGFIEDVSDWLGYFNDNDIVLGDLSTGEIFTEFNSDLLDDYKLKKEKKYKAVKNRLSKGNR
jgi:hypothetical protein